MIPESVTTIADNSIRASEKLTIYGRTGSAAEQYAAENGINFVDNHVPETTISPTGELAALGDEFNMQVGETLNLTFALTPADSSAVITVTSDNSCVAVDGFKMTAKTPGTAVVTASASDGASYTFTVTVIERPVTYGDANGDGKVNVRDVTAIQRHISEYSALTGRSLTCADVDGNGAVDINDATLLQQYLAEFDVILGNKA